MGPSAVEGLVFDLDQTLFDRNAAFASLVDRAVQHAPAHRRAALRAELRTLDGEGYGDRAPLAQRLGALLGWSKDRPGGPMAPFRDAMVQAIQPDPEVRDLLDRLASKYRLGLATDGCPTLQRGKLERLGIEHCFDPIVYTGTLPHSKPHPTIFEAFSKAWQRPAAHLCMVGDHPQRDIQGASDAGMRTVWIRHPRDVLRLEEQLP